MKIPKHGSSLRQVAYARRAFGAPGKTKKQIALDVGYSPSVANSVVGKIEKSRGFNNAMAKLATESNNLALAVLHEFKARGVKDFTNSELIKMLNSVSTAWDRFNKGLIEQERPEESGKNRLRAIIIDRANNQQVPVQDVVPVEVISPIQAEATPTGNDDPF